MGFRGCMVKGGIPEKSFFWDLRVWRLLGWGCSRGFCCVSICLLCGSTLGMAGAWEPPWELQGIHLCGTCGHGVNLLEARLGVGHFPGAGSGVVLGRRTFPGQICITAPCSFHGTDSTNEGFSGCAWARWCHPKGEGGLAPKTLWGCPVVAVTLR